MSNKLNLSFYLNQNSLEISKQLLGKILVTNFNNTITSGIIVETEAYVGLDDRASHVYNNKRTKRTEAMYMQGGVCYVYLCYGMYHLLNVVTNKNEVPHAVLIRAIEPVQGTDIMCIRRKMKTLIPNLTNGPGKLSIALGINKKINKQSLMSDTIWIQDDGRQYNKKDILSSQRIGVDYAGRDAKLPYRFYINNNKWVSKS